MEPDLNSLALTVPGVIYRIDLTLGKIVFANRNIEAISGYSDREVLSSEFNWLDIVVTEDQQIVKDCFEKKDEKFITTEYRIKHKQGGVRWLLNRGVNVEENGSIRWRDGILIDITKQKESEIALKQSEQILQWASNAAKIGGWIINIERKTIQWSDEIYTIREVEKNGEPTWDEAFNYYTPECRPIIANAVERGITNGLPWDHELQIITAKGNKKWIRDIGIPEMLQGKCVALRGVLQDISEKKNAEISLRRREQELELAVQGADLGTWDWNISTGVFSYNQKLAAILGFSVQELGPHFLIDQEAIHPDDHLFVMQRLQDHLQGKSDFFEEEYRLMHKKGFWVWVFCKGKITERGENMKPHRASGTLLDINDRKRAEFEKITLEKKLKEFRSAVDACSIVSITNEKGVIKYANTKFEEISQFKLNELIGKHHNVINSGHHPKSFWRDMWQMIVKGETWRAEVKNKRKNGTYYWVDTFIIPIKNADNKIVEFLSIRNDITEKKENELKLQEALKKAEESDKLKSSFLANISHEIRTPMNAIMGFSELLERPNLSDQKRQEFSRLIHARSHDLLNIVNNILDISRIEAGQVTSVQVVGNINELFERLLLTFRSEYVHLRNKPVIITTKNELSADQNSVVADFIRLYQVLTNLITNAAKFTLSGTIEFGCRFEDPLTLLFWVKDTGIGISEDQLDNIFQPFRQATDTIHQQFGGSGLGLAICKGFVELWNGKIWVESSLGKGSIFYFTIPYSSSMDMSPKPISSEAELGMKEKNSS